MHVDVPLSVFLHSDESSASWLRVIICLPESRRGAATSFMTCSISPPVKPPLTKTSLSLPPDTRSRALARLRTGVGSPIPYTEGGMKRNRAYERKPMKIHGRRKARIGVDNQWRTSATKRFLTVKVQIWRENKPIVLRRGKIMLYKLGYHCASGGVSALTRSGRKDEVVIPATI